MACFIDGWIWEPTDCVVMHCASMGRPVRNSAMYRYAIENLVDHGFIHVINITEEQIDIGLTRKGKRTYKKLNTGR